MLLNMFVLVMVSLWIFSFVCAGKFSFCSIVINASVCVCVCVCVCVLMFVKEVFSYVHQGCIYLNQK